jgi:hypothetical protein
MIGDFTPQIDRQSPCVLNELIKGMSQIHCQMTKYKKEKWHELIMSPSHQNVCGAKGICDLYVFGNTLCSCCAQTREELKWQERTQQPRVGKKWTKHQYTTANRRVKHPLLLSNLPKPAYNPTRIPNGRTSISTKWELKETEGDVKREQAIKPQTSHAKPIFTRMCAKKASMKSWIIFRIRQLWEPRRPPPILLKVPPTPKKRWLYVVVVTVGCSLTGCRLWVSKMFGSEGWECREKSHWVWDPSAFSHDNIVEDKGWPSQALLAWRGKSTICFLSKILLAVWDNVSFIPTMMAGLKLGPFVELEKPLIRDKLLVLLFEIIQHWADLATYRDLSKQRRIYAITAHGNLALANIQEGVSGCMSKLLEDGTNGIERGLVDKNIDDSLELEASSRNIFACSVTNMEGLDIVFQRIPCLLVMNYQMLDDEVGHRDGAKVIIRKTLQIWFHLSMKGNLHRLKKSSFEPVIALDLNICPLMQDEFLPSQILMVFKAIKVIDGMESLGWRRDTGRSECWRDPMRIHNDGQKNVLNDVPINPLGNSLGGESISGHVIAALIITVENPTDLAGLNFRLDGMNNFFASLLPCKWNIPISS